MKLTAQQRAAIREPGNVCLRSCPGSGKTRTVIAKLLLCLDEVRGTTRRVACITHTNAAADEIFERVNALALSEDELYFDVSTIHSFALRYLVLPFHHLLPEFADGVRVLSPEDPVYTAEVDTLIQQHRLDNRARDEFDKIERGPQGALRMVDRIPMGVQAEWCQWLDQNGYTTIGEIVYHAGRLVGHPHVASAVGSRFAWMLVDEFQDSSAGQTFLIAQIHAQGRTRFFCVGDPHQAIHGFTGATPQAFAQFAADIGARTDFLLTGNFRSSRRICECADTLRPGEPAMEALGEHADWNAGPTHVRAATPQEGVLGDFLRAARGLGVPPGAIAILAPSWHSLPRLAAHLRANNIAAIGPGARPYKRAHLIGHLLEPMGAYIEARTPDLAIAVLRSIYFIVMVLSDRKRVVPFGFETKIAVCRMLRAAQEARANHPLAADWVLAVSATVVQLLVEGDLVSEEQGAALLTSATGIQNEILEDQDGAALTVAEMGIFARPNECVQLMTIHKAKGKEFEAVAVIEMNDHTLPNYRVDQIRDAAERQNRLDESRRVAYVAATRAKRILMFISDTRVRFDRYQNLPSRFLAEMGL